jgi:hypothetical protein
MVNAGDALHARNAIAFKQEPENHFSLFDRQVHSTQRAYRGRP